MKMNISLKECNETKYWIELLEATDYIDNVQKDFIYNDCIELEKILTKIVKTTSKQFEQFSIFNFQFSIPNLER